VPKRFRKQSCTGKWNNLIELLERVKGDILVEKEFILFTWKAGKEIISFLGRVMKRLISVNDTS